MRKGKIVLIISFILIGFIIVALPDSDERVFSISEDHGPSLRDVIGLILIISAYVWLGIEVRLRKEKLEQYKSTKFYRTSQFLSGVGLGLIIASVVSDFDKWWIIGVILMASLQIPIFYSVLK